MEVQRPMNTVDKTVAFVRLKGSTDDEGSYNLRKGTGISVHEGLNLKEWSEIERLGPLPGCVDRIRTNYAITRF